MGFQLTGPVNTSVFPVFTGKQGFIALVFVNTKFCKYRLVLQVCKYNFLYISLHWPLEYKCTLTFSLAAVG